MTNAIFFFRGSEFKSSAFQSLLRSRGIKHKYASNTEKCSLAERGIQTINRRLTKYLVHNNTYRFVDILQDMIRSINAAPHASLLSRAPDDISQETLYPVWEAYYLSHAHTQQKLQFRYKVGDRVRISRLLSAMDKSYLGTYSEEIFRVVGRRHSRPPAYELQDILGSKVQGLFYEPELIRADDRPDREYLIRDVIRQFDDPDTGERMAEVNWKGWPKAHRSVISADTIVTRGRQQQLDQDTATQRPFAPVEETTPRRGAATPRHPEESRAASASPPPAPRTTLSGMTLRARPKRKP